MSEGQPIRTNETTGAIKTAEVLLANKQRYPMTLRPPVVDLVSSILELSVRDEGVINETDILTEDLLVRLKGSQGQLQGYNVVSFDQKVTVDVNQIELEHILLLMREAYQDSRSFPKGLVREVARAFAQSKKNAQPSLLRRMVNKIVPTKTNVTQEPLVIDPQVLKHDKKRAEPGKFD